MRKRKKKFEFSKIILCVVSAFAAGVTIFTCVAVIVTGDTSALAYLIPSIFAELATATGFYYTKAKSENRIKLTKLYGREAVEQTERETDYESNNR